jgi:hypothetical protein
MKFEFEVKEIEIKIWYSGILVNVEQKVIN